MQKANIFFQARKWPPEVTTEHYTQSNTNIGNGNDCETDPHQITPIYPQTIHGTLPEPFRKIHQNWIPEPFRNHPGKFTKQVIPNTLRNTYGYSK